MEELKSHLIQQRDHIGAMLLHVEELIALRKNFIDKHVADVPGFIRENDMSVEALLEKILRKRLNWLNAQIEDL